MGRERNGQGLDWQLQLQLLLQERKWESEIMLTLQVPLDAEERTPPRRLVIDRHKLMGHFFLFFLCCNSNWRRPDDVGDEEH